VRRHGDYYRLLPTDADIGRQARGLLGRMGGEGVEPDGWCWNMGLEAAWRARDWRQSAGILDMMRERGVRLRRLQAPLEGE
jgi:hypothetical protein